MKKIRRAYHFLFVTVELECKTILFIAYMVPSISDRIAISLVIREYVLIRDVRAIECLTALDNKSAERVELRKLRANTSAVFTGGLVLALGRWFYMMRNVS